jgi:hypothetical protein
VPMVAALAARRLIPMVHSRDGTLPVSQGGKLWTNSPP